MPKGVEHNAMRKEYGAEKGPRNSVMPKGVEHIRQHETASQAQTAKLRDAERR